MGSQDLTPIARNYIYVVYKPILRNNTGKDLAETQEQGACSVYSWTSPITIVKWETSPIDGAADE